LSFLASVGLAIVVAAPGQSQAANLTSLVSFCTLTNCADGLGPGGGLIADADGNLFGTTGGGGAHGGGTVFEIAKTARGYASTPKILVRFCALANCADGDVPLAGVIADADGNLFGTTDGGGAHNGGTVFEIAKTARGYASTPTILVSFCALTNWDDGLTPDGSLIADADGNLFGATANGGRTAKVRCSRSPAAASSRPPHGSPGRLGRQTVTARASRRSPRSMAGSTMPPQRSATPVSRF
jgi:uncharacterized repeat protein (TIGR03803 family)